MWIWNAQKFEHNGKELERHCAQSGNFILWCCPMVDDKGEDPDEVKGWVYRIAGFETPTHWLGSMPDLNDAKKEVTHLFITIMTSGMAAIDEEMLAEAAARQKRWLMQGQQLAASTRAITQSAVQGRVEEIAAHLQVAPERVAEALKIPLEVLQQNSNLTQRPDDSEAVPGDEQEVTQNEPEAAGTE